MPLLAGSDRTTVSHNLRELLRAGHPHDQAVTAALHHARQSYTAPVAPAQYDFNTSEARAGDGKWTSGGGHTVSAAPTAHNPDLAFQRVGDPKGKLFARALYHATTVVLKAINAALSHGHKVPEAILDTAHDYSNPLSGAAAPGVPGTHEFVSHFGISPMVAAKVSSHILAHGRVAVKKHTGYSADEAGSPNYAELAGLTLELIQAIRSATGDQRPLPSGAEVVAALKRHHARLLAAGPQPPQSYAALTPEALAAAGDIAHKDPSEAQRKAGNYRHGHVTWKGLGITIENAKGSVRKGRAWEQTMADAYGYIKRTESAADGDHVDVFLCDDDLDSDIVFVVNQKKETGRFDEHKCVIGCTNAKKARDVYARNYPDGWKVGPITEMTVPQFKQWLFEGNTGKSVAPASYAGEHDVTGEARDESGEWTKGGAKKGSDAKPNGLRDALNAVTKKHNDEVAKATPKESAPGPQHASRLGNIAADTAANVAIDRGTNAVISKIAGSGAEHAAARAAAKTAATVAGESTLAAVAEDVAIGGAVAGGGTLAAIAWPVAVGALVVGSVVAGGIAAYRSIKRVGQEYDDAEAKDAVAHGKAAGLVVARHLHAGKDLGTLHTKDHVLHSAIAAAKQALIEAAKFGTGPIGWTAKAVGLWQADDGPVSYKAMHDVTAEARDQGGKWTAGSAAAKVEGKAPEATKGEPAEPKTEPHDAAPLPERLVPAEAMHGLLKTVAAQVAPEHREVMLKAVHRMAMLPPKEYRKRAGQAYQKASEAAGINQDVYDATAARLIERWRGSQRAGIVAPVAPNRTMANQTDPGRLKSAVINQTTAKLARNLAGHVRSIPVQRKRLLAAQLKARVREHTQLARHHQRTMMRVHGEDYDPRSHGYPHPAPSAPTSNLGDVAAEAGTRAGVEIAASLIEHGLKIYGAKFLHALTGSGREATPRIAGGGAGG